MSFYCTAPRTTIDRIAQMLLSRRSALRGSCLQGAHLSDSTAFLLPDMSLDPDVNFEPYVNYAPYQLQEVDWEYLIPTSPKDLCYWGGLHKSLWDLLLGLY